MRGDWDPDVDGEDVLCVCMCCSAELHADFIAEECPRCGAPADEAFPLPKPTSEKEEANG